LTDVSVACKSHQNQESSKPKVIKPFGWGGTEMARIPALRRVRRTMAVVCWTALASLVALTMSAGASSRPSSALSKPSAPGYFAPYPGGDITPLAESGDITAGSCTYRQAIDNPHISSTAPRATSVHGWWLRVSGTCPSTANVDTYLQAYWCDQFGCRWIVVASASGDVGPGGGSGNRITARRTCSSSSKTVGWQGFVDVDLNGVSDPPGYTYSPPVNLTCVP
jgi:hypothetical protein